jgi:hypothetical protein
LEDKNSNATVRNTSVTSDYVTDFRAWEFGIKLIFVDPGIMVQLK